MTDNEIIREILQGNHHAYRLLVEKYQSVVFRTCMGFLHQKEDAEDLTQEIFIQVYQSLSNFKGNSAFSTWLYRITVNAALNKIRKSTKNIIVQRLESIFKSDKNDAIEMIIPENEDPENILIQDEHRKWIQNALDSLPENQRTAIILSKYDELSQKTIAEIMNTTEGAVEALIQRAKAGLRNKLSATLKKN